jgi:hypothetical protein
MSIMTPKPRYSRRLQASRPLSLTRLLFGMSSPICSGHPSPLTRELSGHINREAIDWSA